MSSAYDLTRYAIGHLTAERLRRMVQKNSADWRAFDRLEAFEGTRADLFRAAAYFERAGDADEARSLRNMVLVDGVDPYAD